MSAVSPKIVSLSDRIYARLRQQIREGCFAAGDRLPTERVIAEQEGVSRTVVREAVARLVANDLVEARQGSGLYVSALADYPAFQINPSELAAIDDVLKLLELRSAIETEMAGLAAARRDDRDLEAMAAALSRMEHAGAGEAAARADADFHAAIATATKNAYFERLREFLGARLVPPRRLLLAGRPAGAEQAYADMLSDEHRAVFEAIEARDGDAARAAACRHLRNSIARHASLTPNPSLPGQG